MHDQFNIQFNFSDGDAFYQALIESHQDLSLDQSHQLNARLVLMMANQIGNVGLLGNILAASRANLLKETI
jgi:hypothetical protein